MCKMNPESMTGASTTSGRVRTSFDPDSELPRLHKWFAENPHPSRLTLQLYVRELNGLDSRKSRKLLEVHNLCYWFKNARAAYKRAELRMKKNHGSTSLEQNHHLHDHFPNHQQLDGQQHQQLKKRSRISPKCHHQPQQLSTSSLNEPSYHDQDNYQHNQRQNNIELQQQHHEQKHIRCQLHNAVSLTNQHHFHLLADQQRQLGLTNCLGSSRASGESPGVGSEVANMSAHNIIAGCTDSEKGAPNYIFGTSQQCPTLSPTSSEMSTRTPALGSLLPSVQTKSTPTRGSICEDPTHPLVMMSSRPTDAAQTGIPANMVCAMTTGCPVNLLAALQHQLTTGPSQLQKPNSYSNMDLANALDCILSRAKNYTAAAAAAAVLAAANSPMASRSQNAADHGPGTTAEVAATNHNMSSSTGQFSNRNVLNAPAAGPSSSPSSSTSVHTNPMSSSIAAHHKYQQQQSLSCPNSFFLGRGSALDTSASLTGASSVGPSQSTTSKLGHINHLNPIPNLLDHHQHLSQNQQQHIQYQSSQLFTPFNPSSYQFALGMLDDKQLDSNVLNSMAFPTSAHPQPPSPSWWR